MPEIPDADSTSLKVILIGAFVGVVIWSALQIRNGVKAPLSLISLVTGAVVVFGMNFFILAWVDYLWTPLPNRILIAMGILAGFIGERLWIQFANFVLNKFGLDIDLDDSNLPVKDTK